MITTDRAALDDWHPVAFAGDPPIRTRLLGQTIDAAPGRAALPDGRALPVREKWGVTFTTLGQPNRDLFDIAEAAETDRRFVPCGWVTMRASGLRVVENFLDMAHFPYIHTNILGAEPQTEVPAYHSEIRRDVDEVWATNCTFFQSRIAATESAGISCASPTGCRGPSR